MGSRINEKGEFQSDKYPTCPPGKVPLSVKDKMAQDLLWILWAAISFAVSFWLGKLIRAAVVEQAQ